MLYPSLYFGQPETVANLRPTCTVTLPAGMDLSSVETTCNPGDGTLCRSYTYNQYPVGCESIPDTAIQALLHSEPTNICKKSGSAAASDLGNSAKETASGIFQKVLAFVACMMLLEAKTTYFLSFFVSWFNTFRYCDF